MCPCGLAGGLAGGTQHTPLLIASAVALHRINTHTLTHDPHAVTEAAAMATVGVLQISPVSRSPPIGVLFCAGFRVVPMHLVVLVLNLFDGWSEELKLPVVVAVDVRSEIGI